EQEVSHALNVATEAGAIWFATPPSERAPESRIQNPESRIQNPESRIQNPESICTEIDNQYVIYFTIFR
ncbi:hypothetical protein, partial [Photorhabdus luminescens]|uniref:hypothetical protein n=1 Tax=Photorhabdus luminescens TaxID=29488 RepID=UPI00159EE17E